MSDFLVLGLIAGLACVLVIFLFKFLKPLFSWLLKFISVALFICLVYLHESDIIHLLLKIYNQGVSLYESIQ